MARLIDADALEGYVLTQCSWYDNRDEDEAYNAVADAPTVDAETVRRGKWLGMFRGRAKCSLCETDQEVYTFVGNVTQKYCAMCGARMDAQTDGQTGEGEKDG